jgi:uncharacterized repeat protein (TIGR04052 family)
MTPIHLLRAALWSALALGLAACASGSEEEGIEASLKAQPLSAAHTHDDAAKAANSPKHGDEEETIASFRRSDGMRIDLQLGLVNLVPVGFQACVSRTAALGQSLLQAVNPVGVAQAHGGDEGEAPEGAVSVVGEDSTSLGTLKATPGTYCGLIVELQPGGTNTAKHGGALDTSMVGASVNVAPCYYETTVGVSDAEAEAATAHHCIQAKFTGEARRVTLPFPQPVTLDGSHRELALTVVVRYQEWFEGVDFTTLAGSAAQQAKLADNVAASLQVLSDDAQQLVNLAFEIKVGGQEAVCGATYQGLGTTALPLRMEGFRYYASDFELENASGVEKVQLASKPNGTVYQDSQHGVALLGHAQGCDSPVPVRNLALTGTVGQGDYERLCFTLGVPFELAHSDPATAPSPLNVTGMDWSWLFGRMFFRFDSVVDPDNTAANFFVHLGSTGCSNGSSDFGAAPDAECTYPNRPRICLPYGEIAEGHAIVADIAPMLSELDIGQNTEGTAPGCMSFPGDPECTTIIPKFGLDYALHPPDLVPRRTQALFTVGE